VLRNAWIIFTLPALSFWVIILLGKRLPAKGAEVGIAAVGASFVLSCVAAAQWIGRATTGEGAEKLRPAVDHKLWTWFSNGQVKVPFATHVDGLAVTMLFVVSFISLMVHVYSTSYMHGDRRYTHFFAALSLFTASMLLMVTASSTLMILIGWEGMGLCSFMLIGHWWEEQANSDAALKAFFTTRTGDIGLLVGIVTLFFANGQSFDIARLNHRALAGQLNHGFLVAGAVCLFIGAIGKSAQFPLHTWLPDAMAGPTPVSALIHAATMVVAGVYLVARCYGVFWKAFSITHAGLNPIAVIGAITIVIAAALAFVQDDIKKVLAYSTVSQLGYMIMALGVGAWTGGIFHLFTHAFFKGLLFLGAGSVSHAVHSFDMKKDMGGLKKFMPVTFVTFIIGSVALAGIFPFAGFWSKDEILLAAGKNGYTFFMLVGLVGAFMTACYMARCVYLTFYGDYRGHGHPHESPPAITVPLSILAVFSVAAGWLGGFGIHAFAELTRNETFLEARIPEHPFSFPAAGISLAIALGGVFVGALWYFRNLGPHGITQRSPALRSGLTLLENKYYLDALYTDGVVGGIKGPIARGAYWVNQNVIDGVVNGVALVSRKVAGFTYDIIDQRVVDGVVNGIGAVSEEGGGALRHIQTGRVQQYAAFLFGAVVVFGAALVAFT
jgi:NADH-quinone oxidoreductase subunit L